MNLNMNNTLERKGITRCRVRPFPSEASFGNYQQRPHGAWRPPTQHTLHSQQPPRRWPLRSGASLSTNGRGLSPVDLSSLPGGTSSRERHDAAWGIVEGAKMQNGLAPHSHVVIKNWKVHLSCGGSSLEWRAWGLHQTPQLGALVLGKELPQHLAREIRKDGSSLSRWHRKLLESSELS